MARVQNTLIGKSSGSVGGATFSTWKGINVLKSKAISVANPNTVAQQTQKNRLTLMVAIFRQISAAVQVGFKTLAIGKSEYNAFMSVNIQNATLSAAPPVVTFVPANMKTAKGTIGATPNDGVAATSASDNATISWDDALTPVGSAATDISYGVVYNATKDIWATNFGNDRTNGSLIVDMGVLPDIGDVLHSWLFFKDELGDAVSDSTYSTFTVVA